MYVFQKEVVFLGEKEISEEKKAGLKEVYDLIEKFLDGNNYIAGDFLSIADFSIVTSLTSWAVLLRPEASEYPRISTYLERMKKLPYYEEANGPGLKAFENIIKEKISGNV